MSCPVVSRARMSVALSGICVHRSSSTRTPGSALRIRNTASRTPSRTASTDASAWPKSLMPSSQITVETPDGLAVVYPPWGCGHCRYCDATEEQLCDHVAEAGLVHDGGYAEYVQVPHPKYLFPIGDLDPAFAATFGCSSLTPYRVQLSFSGLALFCQSLRFSGVILSPAVATTKLIQRHLQFFSAHWPR